MRFVCEGIQLFNSCWYWGLLMLSTRDAVSVAKKKHQWWHQWMKKLQRKTRKEIYHFSCFLSYQSLSFRLFYLLIRELKRQELFFLIRKEVDRKTVTYLLSKEQEVYECLTVFFDCTEETCFSRCSVVLKCLSFSCLRVSVSLFRILLFSLLLFSVFRRAIQETEALPTKHTKQEERRRKEGGNKRGERMPFLYCFSTDKTRGE